MPDVKIKKDGQEYGIGVIPQSMYDDVEDLKDGKVDKSGDTMSGNLIINNSNGDTYLDVGGNGRGVIDIYGNNPSYKAQIYNPSSDALTSNRTLYVPNKSGTLALTSDITDVGTSAKLVNLYISGTSSAITNVVQEVLNAITTDNKICIVNAIHQYSGIRYLNGYVYADKSYGSFILQTYTQAYKCNINNGAITYSQITQ